MLTQDRLHNTRRVSYQKRPILSINCVYSRNNREGQVKGKVSFAVEDLLVRFLVLLSGSG